MKFKVAYTVDLEEVPNELNKILQKVKNTLTDKFPDQIDSACKEMIVSQNFSNAYSIIQKIRENILSLDHTMEDCMEGMTQYVEVHNSLAAQDKEETEPEDSVEESSVLEEAEQQVGDESK